jgi:RNA polymerase sigma-70 factor, ECF subfamily
MTSPRESREPASGEADEGLVALFLATRSEAAFRALYRRHAPALYLLARRLLGPRGAAAEDAVQEAWMRAAEGLAGFQWRSTLRTWLSGIVVRRCAELARRGVRRPEVALASIPEPAAQVPGMGEKLDLERALRSLPDGYREALVLHDLAGFTHAEIAELTGTTSGSSKSQLFRARRALRARMAAEKER